MVLTGEKRIIEREHSPSACLSTHHTSNMNRHGFENGPLRQETGNKHYQIKRNPHYL